MRNREREIALALPAELVKKTQEEFFSCLYTLADKLVEVLRNKYGWGYTVKREMPELSSLVYGWISDVTFTKGNDVGITLRLRWRLDRPDELLILPEAESRLQRRLLFCTQMLFALGTMVFLHYWAPFQPYRDTAWMDIGVLAAAMVGLGGYQIMLSPFVDCFQIRGISRSCSLLSVVPRQASSILEKELQALYALEANNSQQYSDP